MVNALLEDHGLIDLHPPGATGAIRSASPINSPAASKSRK